MKFNKTVLGLTMVLVVAPSWGHGEHGTNTVWRSGDGTAILSGNGECSLPRTLLVLMVTLVMQSKLKKLQL